MNHKFYSLLLSLLIIAALICISCDNSTGPEETHEFPAAISAVATDITLYVYSDGWGTALDTVEMTTEGPVTLDIEEEIPYHDPPRYFSYAKADGFYAEIYTSQKGETITIDLDSVPQVANSITGVIFEQQIYFAPCYFAEKDIAISVPGGGSIAGTTDEQGRYGFSGLEADLYLLHLANGNLPEVYYISNTSGTDYNDLYFLSEMVVDAPNIYLYPSDTIDVNIDIDLPNGGHIIASEPSYNNGWSVNVTPDGLIDGQYEYLFYEVLQAVPLNVQDGWLLDGTKLESELRYLLANLGFVGREIDDFIEYWLPRLGDSPYCAIYPQNVEAMITLNIEPVPDNIFRMIFLFRPLQIPISLNTLPLPDAIRRDGFTVIEWGGILLTNY